MKLAMAGVLMLFNLLFVTIVTRTEGARILAYFATPSISHQVVFRPITQELARRGHEVIVVTPNPVFTDRKPPENFTEIDVHEVSYNSWNKLLPYHRGNKFDILTQVLGFFDQFATIFDLQMQTSAVKDMLKDKDKNYFDILLLEACNRLSMGFADKFDAPAITFSSFGVTSGQYSYLGGSSHYLIYSTPGRLRSYNLTFWERGLELIMQIGLEYIITATETYDHYIAKKHFGDHLPTLEELRKKVYMMFINEHPLWADNHPVPTSIQYMGGIHLEEEKELPEDLKNYLDSSRNGVIYVSFGTNVLPSMLAPEKMAVMTKVFSELPYDVMWKWDKGVLAGQSKNIKLFTWLPQADILKHPNVILFVTQGGLQSTDEAIDAAVPLIGIPMLGDQWYNTEKYVYHGIGEQLDLATLTEQDFKHNILNIIKNQSYKDNIVKLRNLMRSYPIKPLDNVIWWIEHVITHGGEHLRAPAADMSWVDYYEVKLVLVALALMISILVLICYTFKFIFKFVYKSFKNNTKRKVL